MARHRHYEHLISLLPYHELTERQQQALDGHLEQCERCRKTLDSTRKLFALLERLPAPAIQDAVIREARLQGMAAIRAAGRRGHLLTTLSGLFSTPPAPRWAFAVGTCGLLAAVFFAGRLTAPGAPFGADRSLFAEGNVRVTNIRLSGDDNRAIEATFDLVKHIRLRGSMDDPQVQRILASALVSAENPGVRLRAVSGVSSGGTMPAEREVRAALILAVKTDPNDAVRKEALLALLRYPPDREIRDALLEVLTRDPNAGLRIAAINGLDVLRAQGFGPDDSQVRTFRERVQNEQNMYVRVKNQSMFEEKLQ